MTRLGDSAIEKRLLAIHGDGLGEYLRDLYVTQMLSVRGLRTPLNARSDGCIKLLLEKYGIELRSRSAAIANQWARKPGRRREQADRMRGLANARATRGEHWAKGHTKETHPGLARYAAKLAERKWLTTDAALEKASASSKALHRRDPNTHSQATMKPSRIELLMMKWLEDMGLRYEFQRPVVSGDDLFFLDFYLPDIGIGVEVTKSRDRVPPGRLKALFAAGIPTIAIYNHAVERTDMLHVHEAIALAKRGEFNPSTIGECWVGAGRRNNSPGLKADANEPLR